MKRDEVTNRDQEGNLSIKKEKCSKIHIKFKNTEDPKGIMLIFEKNIRVRSSTEITYFVFKNQQNRILEVKKVNSYFLNIKKNNHNIRIIQKNETLISITDKIVSDEIFSVYLVETLFSI